MCIDIPPNRICFAQSMNVLMEYMWGYWFAIMPFQRGELWVSSHISFEHTIQYYYGTDYMRFGISIDEDIQVSKGMFVAPTMHVVEVEVLVEVRSSKVAQKVKKKH